ncbi:MAG: hypothetical protein F4X59_16165 [Holophagales bacterium]|nr:hypothetical protein [Holophagales bacterium]MXX61200.1 hypothetical protein [Holophagales bacterium]MYC11644.1 hypothetical protein [Holophagales bacterium]MYD22102.1 hypothetical protein [Holophagales bacterium]MYI32835.1 hypothetical protein [Holophagales bacterium]
MKMRKLRAAGLGAASLLILAGASLAQERGFYAGYTVSAEQFDATFSKSVDNTDPDTLVPEPRRGMVFHDQDSADTVDIAAGFVVGYRTAPGDGDAYLSTELDVMFHSGEPDGRLAGVGTSPDRKQLGESWPDAWSLDKKRSYGLTLRLGFLPDSLQSRDMSLYLLGGVRLFKSRFSTTFEGCLNAEPCSASEFVSGSDGRDVDPVATTWGLGLERRFGSGEYARRIALRFEATYSQYGDESWVADFPDVRVTVPSMVEAEGIGVTVSMVRLFGVAD